MPDWGTRYHETLGKVTGISAAVRNQNHVNYQRYFRGPSDLGSAAPSPPHLVSLSPLLLIVLFPWIPPPTLLLAKNNPDSTQLELSLLGKLPIMVREELISSAVSVAFICD